ncbi:MAG: TIGR00282 family metallophosphoesterase [Thermovirgaceae bacterium]|nr:TIGR00282 family metallophosphoesterase [Thermovirgaceae bacterium]
MKILFVGDVVGKPGRKALSATLPCARNLRGPFDFVVANAENAAGGFGLTPKIMEELFGLGVDALTSGNHIWDNREALPLLDDERRLVRPANYPPSSRGSGSVIIEKKGLKLAILNLQGRIFMQAIDCPFRRADEEIISLEGVPVLVDVHAEATSEKRALGFYLDGRVAAVVGTHTHVQTADEEILDGGTAYISDVGMTGGHGGVIGMEKEAIISRFLTGMPSKFEVCNKDIRMDAVVIDIDEKTGKSLAISRLSLGIEKEQ